jgi:hypothetical protein
MLLLIGVEAQMRHMDTGRKRLHELNKSKQEIRAKNAHCMWRAHERRMAPCMTPFPILLPYQHKHHPSNAVMLLLPSVTSTEVSFLVGTGAPFMSRPTATLC